MRQSRQNWPISGPISRQSDGKSVVRMPTWISKMVTTRQIDSYPRRIDAYLRLKRVIYQGFEHKIGRISCSTFLVKVMSQNGFWAKLCVRETFFDSSIQAHGTGDFMSQNWRFYGLSDTAAIYLTHRKKYTPPSPAATICSPSG
jgi:hypothetical protein